MPNLLSFEWERDRDGYDLIEFNPAGIDWDYQGPDYKVAPPERASPSTIRLLGRWGMHLSPGVGTHADWKPSVILEPVGDLTVRYRPLDQHPGLFMEFAGVGSKPEAIKAFADKYGQLHLQGVPDYLRGWSFEIRRMRDAVKLMEKGKKAGSLRDWVQVYNRRLDDLIGEKARASAAFQLMDTDDPLRPSLHAVPDDLLSAMWLQLAQQVSSSTGLRRCAWCSTWFVYGTGTGRRKSGHYCSPKCQKAKWKRQKDQKDQKELRK